ncbi:MAG TPA: ABC transporter permease, partial [Candidatus Baltobacteraceae bacterium]|nr:ABC transporter permease [Candidatus Baltobacteraceae bacterium]
MNKAGERRETRDEGKSSSSVLADTFSPNGGEGRGEGVLTPRQLAWRRFKRNRPAVISTWFLILLLIVVLAWPLILKISGTQFAQLHDPDQLSDAQFAPPDAQHWFGTDVHGRDLFSRLLYGAQVSLLVGVVGALVSLIIGVLWGAIAGYAGGKIDTMLMRIVDVLYSLPTIIFVIVLIATLGEMLKQSHFVHNSPALEKGLRVILLFVGLGAVSWLTMARIVRGQVLSLRTRAFVEASRALGA